VQGRVRGVVLGIVGCAGAGVLAFLVVTEALRDAPSGVRPLTRALTGSRSLHAGFDGLAAKAELLKSIPPEDVQIFWRLTAVGDELIPPLRLWRFLREGARPADPNDRLRFVLGYVRHTRTACSAPLAAELMALVPSLPAGLQTDVLDALSRARCPGAASLLLKLLREDAIDRHARRAAVRALAVHADSSHVPAMAELWRHEEGPPREAIEQAIRSVAPYTPLPLPEGGEIPPGNRIDVLRLEDLGAVDLALQHFRLYWNEAAREPINDLLAGDRAPAATRSLALAAPALSTRPETIRMVAAVSDGEPAAAAAAAEALRLMTGEDLPDPGPDALFDPGSGLAARVREWLAAAPEEPVMARMLEGAKQGRTSALRSLAARAEADRLRTPAALGAMRKALAAFAALPARARPFFAYAAAGCLGPGDLALLEEAIRGENDQETRTHLLWAAGQAAGGEKLRFLTQLLLEVDPASGTAADVAKHLSAASPADAVVGAFPPEESIRAQADRRWRLALALRHFPCPAARTRLLALAGDPVARVREAAVYAASALAGNTPPAAKAGLSSTETAQLVRRLLLKSGEAGTDIQ
jgi:hypothetical protein